jgi:toxin CptA
MTSAPAIGFEYRPSRLLVHLPATVLALALLAIATCGLPWWPRLLLAILALGLWFHAVRHRPDAGVTAAGWAGGEGDWSLRRADGEDVPATLLSFRALGAFVLLRLRGADRRVVTLLLAPDNSDADIRRRLRMRLAVARATGHSAPT